MTPPTHASRTRSSFIYYPFGGETGLILLPHSSQRSPRQLGGDRWAHGAHGRRGRGRGRGRQVSVSRFEGRLGGAVGTGRAGLAGWRCRRDTIPLSPNTFLAPRLATLQGAGGLGAPRPGGRGRGRPASTERRPQARGPGGHVSPAPLHSHVWPQGRRHHPQVHKRRNRGRDYVIAYLEGERAGGQPPLGPAAPGRPSRASERGAALRGAPPRGSLRGASVTETAFTRVHTCACVCM